MTPNYNLLDECTIPEVEFQIEEMKKRLHCSMANFAQIRFKKAIEARMSAVKNAR